MPIHAIDRPGQFIISERPVEVPEGWSYDRAGRFHIHVHPALPLVRTETEGEITGVLLGWPVSRERGLLRPGDHNADVRGPSDAEPEGLYGLGGRWVYLRVEQDRESIYLDPCGSLPLVYSDGIAASTVSLMPPGPVDEELERLMDIPARDRWYPFGLTQRRDVRRLVPNFRLDLSTWQATRHYPARPPAPETVERAAATIIEEVRRTAAAFASAWGLVASLTAGRDSRMLLACLRPYLDDVYLFTREGYAGSAPLDCAIAPRIAREHGLQHDIVARADADEPALEAWQDRAGHCVAGAVWRCARMDAEIRPEHSLAPGMAGEVARAYYWKPSDTPNTQLSPEELVQRLHLPAHPTLTSAAAEWLATLPPLDAFGILDLLYLEQRIGCWASPQVYGPLRSAPTVFLLSHRRIIEAMLGLPPAVKRKSQVADEIIRQAWPELLSVPFNQYVGWPAAKQKLLWLPRKARFHLGALRRRLMPS